MEEGQAKADSDDQCHKGGGHETKEGSGSGGFGGPTLGDGPREETTEEGGEGGE